MMGYAPALPEVDPLSPFSMEVLIVDPHMFEEPLLLKDPEKDLVSDLAVDFGARVIKKVLDLLRDSTPFQMVVMVTLYSRSYSLFPIF